MTAAKKADVSDHAGRQGGHAKGSRRYIYAPLANSNGAILEELDKKNPVVYAGGGRKFKMFQFLSDEVGLPAFRQHLWQVVGMAMGAADKSAFDRAFSRAFPQKGEQLEFNLNNFACLEFTSL